MENKFNHILRGNVAVLGYGIEGVSLTRFLHRHGAKVTVFDERKKLPEAAGELDQTRGVKLVHGPFNSFAGFDTIVVSPGIRPDLQPVTEAAKRGASVTTATNLFLSACPCPVIGVTGTKGKGTTSALIAEMLKTDGRDAFLGGNIGTPPLDFLEQLTAETIVVLELSSFQIMSLTRSPQVAVILMVTSEHLDYHKDEKEYFEAKANLVKFQNLNDVSIVNIDYPNSVAIGRLSANTPFEVSTRDKVTRGVCVDGGTLVYCNRDIKEEIIGLENILIPGKHNWENAAAASCAAKTLGVKIHAIRHVLSTFRGLPHRLELVSESGGVRYYDDSFSTTPETAIAAIAAFTEPKVLILGGSSKHSDFTELGKVISKSDSIRAIIGIGLEWGRIKEKIYDLRFKIYENCRNMKEIVVTANKIAEPGDVVLLSPACASFDMFQNYKDRGKQFKEQVNKLI
jgi:UDP-N-acetylmuramoylalanine--D-glutamate ligase